MPAEWAPLKAVMVAAMVWYWRVKEPYRRGCLVYAVVVLRMYVAAVHVLQLQVVKE
jgi:hypothetical protein